MATETTNPPYDTNTAKLPNETHASAPGRSRANEKRECAGGLRVIVFDASQRTEHTDGFSTPLTARFYMGRSSAASVVYCDVWVHTRDGRRYFTGSGSAGGGGYHKQSAAFGGALSDAGIALGADIGGCGEGAMRRAAEAIMREAGYGDLPFHVLHT